MTTSVPWAAYAVTISRPSPRLPPVTRATLPVRSVNSDHSFVDEQVSLLDQCQGHRAQELADPHVGLAGASSGVAALEHDRELEAGQNAVPVDLVDIPRRVLGVVLDQLGAGGQTPGGGQLSDGSRHSGCSVGRPGAHEPAEVEQRVTDGGHL